MAGDVRELFLLPMFCLFAGMSLPLFVFLLMRYYPMKRR